MLRDTSSYNWMRCFSMKKIGSFFIVFLLSLTLFSHKVKANPEDLVQHAKSAVLMEASTGMVLTQKNASLKLAPASMTKIMSMILIADRIAANTLKLDDLVTTSEYAQSMGGSQVYLEFGERMSVHELLKCILIASANDATVAMAEHISGSEDAFVTEMNEKAKELGAINTNFKDATGLTTVDHYSTAYDMAILSRHLIRKHGDLVLKYTSIYDDYIRKDTERKFWLVNTNKLINKVDGVDGLKTGWTREAGYCLSATMVRDGMRLISVVMGEASAVIRNAETVSLLNYGFAQYESRIVLDKDYVIGTVEDIRYRPSKFELVRKEEVTIIVKKNLEKKPISIEILSYPNYETKTPGTLKLKYGEIEIGTYEFESKEPIARRSFFDLMGELLKSMFL